LTSVRRSEVLGKFLNVVLEKDGEDNWIDCVRNEEALHRIKKERNILHTIKGRKKEIQLVWSHLACELPSKTHY
jgi:hypothetical protein